MLQYTREQLVGAGIYSIVNTATGKIYIGQTTARFVSRWRTHRDNLNRGVHANRQLQADWNYYGSSVFEFRILERVSASRIDMESVERRYLDGHQGEMLYNVVNTRPAVESDSFRLRVREVAEQQGIS